MGGQLLPHLQIPGPCVGPYVSADVSGAGRGCRGWVLPACGPHPNQQLGLSVRIHLVQTLCQKLQPLHRDVSSADAKPLGGRHGLQQVLA